MVTQRSVVPVVTQRSIVAPDQITDFCYRIHGVSFMDFAEMVLDEQCSAVQVH
jgi:hypothetical protein